MTKLKEKAQVCTFEKRGEEAFRAKMEELIKTGATNPTGLSMSDWYYIQEHAEKCTFCFNRFEELAAKSKTNGPTTLRK